MRKFLIFLGLALSSLAYGDVKISQLPLGTASTTGTSDAFPYVDIATSTTKRLKLSTLKDIPTLADPTFCTDKALTGYSSTTGTITAADSILEAIEKLNGNMGTLGASISVGTIDGIAPSANGLVFSTPNLYAQSASTTFPGMVNNTTQSFSGNKTFTGSVSLAGSGSGTVTVQTQAAAGTYNFNLPTSAGTSGQPLLSGGGSSSPMTFGSLGRNQIAVGNAYRVLTNGAGGELSPGVAPGTSGNVLTSDGTQWASTALPAGGTVTSVALALPTFITVSGSPVTTSGTLTGTLATQSANAFFAGPTSGAAAQPTFRPIGNSDIPQPTASSLGGIIASTAVTNQFVTGVDTTGTITRAQPAFSNISGFLGQSQMPQPLGSSLGGILASTAVTNQFLTGVSTTGAVTRAQPAFTDISGSLARTQIAVGTANQVIVNTAGGDMTSGVSPGTSGNILTSSGGAWVSSAPATSGTVTSVALSLPSTFSVSGSPVTSSGTLTATYANQSANTHFSGPASGSATTPAFRFLVNADMPQPTTGSLGGIIASTAVANQFVTGVTTTGTITRAQPAFSDISGTAGVTQGGTGTSTQFTQGSVVFADGSGIYAQDNASLFFNDTTNSLGVLTTSPLNPLTVAGTSVTPLTASGEPLGLSSTRAAIVSGNLVGGINFISNDTSFTAPGVSVANINAVAEATHGVAQLQTGLQFAVTTGSTKSEAMRLTAGGALVVGDTATSQNATVKIGKTYTTPASTVFAFVSAPMFSDTTGTNTNNVGGARFVPTIASTNTSNWTGDLGNSFMGLSAGATLTAGATGTMTSIVGVFNQFVNPSAMNVTTYRANFVRDPSNTGGGVITGQAGTVIEDMTVATNNTDFLIGQNTIPTGNWSIYSNSLYNGFIRGSMGIRTGTTTPTPTAPLAIGVSGAVALTDEQIELRSDRQGITTGELIAGISMKSNDTNLTDPGIKVAYMQALAEATHTASVLDTGIAFRTTKTLTDSEKLRITGAGSMGLGTSSPAHWFQQHAGSGQNYHQLTNDVTGTNQGSGTLLGIDSSGNAEFRQQGALSLGLFTSGVKRVDISSAGVITLKPLTNGAVLSDANGVLSNVAPGTSGNVLTSNGTTWTSATPGAGAGGMTFVGAVKYATSASCRWQVTSSTIGSFTADTDCATPTATDNVTAPATKIPAVTLTVNSTSDYYKFEAVGMFYKTYSQNNACLWRFSDGTASSELQVSQTYNGTLLAYANNAAIPIISGMIKFGSTGSKTVNIQALSTDNTNPCWIAAGDNVYGETLTINVYRVPVGTP